MKRTLMSLAGILAIGSVGFGPAPAAQPSASKDPCLAKASKWERQQCEDFSHSAPGDEYFGRMKLSYLGINNTFHDEAIRAGDYTTDSNIINKVSFADDALQAWSRKYPGDPQLARSYFLAIAMFKKIYVPSFQQEAWKYMHLLVQRFPTSYFGKLEKTDIAHGFTEHYFADALPCPTPVPSGVVLTSAAMPEAASTPRPAPGQPNVQIITPPCIQPTPEPEPTPSLVPTAMPSPTSSPR